MSATAPLPPDHPMKLSWEAYKASDDFANIRQRAASDEHLDGSLWAAFAVGWNARPIIAATAPVHYPWQNKPCDDCGGTLDCVYVSDEDWKALQAGRPEGTEIRGHYICSRCMDSAARRVGRRVVGEVHYGWQNKGEPGLVVSPTPPTPEDTSASVSEPAVEKALRLLGRYPPECSCDGVGHDYCPVRDFVDAEDTLRAALAAKTAEIERLRERVRRNEQHTDHLAAAADAKYGKVMAERDHAILERDALKAQLAAAENRGFRKAADWLEAVSNQDVEGTLWGGICALRAEADRREGADA